MPDKVRSEPVTSSVAVTNILIPKKFRPCVEKDVKKLAHTIKMDGLLHPIGVKLNPDPSKPEKYILVYGGHRLSAHKLLKESHIRAFVIDFTDEDDALSATCAENLFRSDLSMAEYRIALKYWATHWRKKHPKSGHSSAKGRANAKKRWAKTAVAAADAFAPPNSKPDDSGPQPEHEPGPEPQPEPEEEREESFAEVAGRDLDMDPDCVRRDERIARRVGDENLRALEAAGVPEATVRKIAALPEQHRAPVGSLVMAGDAFDRAVYHCEHGCYPPEEPEKPDPVDGGDSQRTDEEWVKFHCAGLLPLLKYQAKFTAAAISYRQMTPARQAFREAFKAKVKQKGTTVPLNDPCLQDYARSANQSHPMYWVQCSKCEGTGSVRGADEVPGKCMACQGAAFKTTMER